MNYKNTLNKELDINAQLKISRIVIQIAKKMNTSTGLDEAVEDMMSDFVDLVDADEGAIQLLHPTSSTTPCTLVHQEDKARLLDKRLDALISGMAIRQNRCLRTDDISSLFGDIRVPPRYADVSSVIAAPLLKEEEIIGVVNLIKKGEKFSDTDFDMVCLLASHIGEFVEHAHLREQLFAEEERLQINLESRFSVHGIIGESPALVKVFNVLEQIIPTDARVVLLGESGTGKELVSKCIHYAGPRKNKPFVALDCGAIPANLLESELFGYVRGAFTGAMRDRKGLIEQAHTGTLFLDEITNMNLETQSKLLRVIQESELRPLGSNKMRRVDVRIIVAASKDLTDLVNSGKFRSDLFYRLNVVTVKIPPLRDRIEDIPVLAHLFLKRFTDKHGKSLNEISPPALQILEQHPWPGNIRELENVIERAVVMTHYKETELTTKLLPDEIVQSDIPRKDNGDIKEDLSKLVEKFECELIRKVLISHKWNKSAAARALNISEAVIRYKMKRLKIAPSNHLT